MSTYWLDSARRFFLRKVRDSKVRALNPHYPQSVLVSRATYSPWYADKGFMRVFDAVRSSTLVDIYRCHELWTLIEQIVDVPGEVLEVGVWKGGTGALISRRLGDLESNKRVFLCDTFAGVVKSSSKDTLYRGGEHADTSEQEVLGLLAALDVSNRAELLKGIFPEQTGGRLEQSSFAFCHIDVDSYLSAKDIFDWIAPRLSLHGIVVFDDYGFWGCEGVSCLVEELAARRDFIVLRNLNGHAVFIKVKDRCDA